MHTLQMTTLREDTFSRDRKYKVVAYALLAKARKSAYFSAQSGGAVSQRKQRGWSCALL